MSDGGTRRDGKPGDDSRVKEPAAGANRIAAQVLAEDPDALGQVIRWIAVVLASPRFWRLRGEWSDLSQATLAGLLESLREGRFDHSRDFRTYVQGIARNTAFQALELGRRNLPLEFEHKNRIAATDDAESRVISVQLIHRAMNLLSEECRDLITSYFLEERSYAEVASTMGIPEGTVKSRLFRCLESACRIVGGDGARRSPRGLVGRRASKPRTPEP